MAGWAAAEGRDTLPRLTRDEALLVRATAEHGLLAEFVYAHRIWLPVERRSGTSGRARCRECGSTIRRGEPAVAFQFDPRAGSGQWGRLTQAYVHAEDCGAAAGE